jgi:23S rRNA (adenine2030-N6)-methyltransferase
MNIHYGKIGDLWKHLPLAEILSIEKPVTYWDPYAGSAEYPLTHSWERDYGVFHFLEEAAQTPNLRDSIYLKLLTRTSKENPSIYPGSPNLAMTILGRSAEYLFCDTDSRSIDSIRRVAQARGLSVTRVRCLVEDGLAILQKNLSETSDQSLARQFALIDPYNPFERSRDGIHATDLFFRMTSKGAKAMLWYGWDTSETREQIWTLLRESFRSHGPKGLRSYWCGEIALAEGDRLDRSACPGVNGCGVLCANLSDASVHACTRLGNSLAATYHDARLPDNHSGAVNFRTVEPQGL